MPPCARICSDSGVEGGGDGSVVDDERDDEGDAAADGGLCVGGRRGTSSRAMTALAGSPRVIGPRGPAQAPGRGGGAQHTGSRDNVATVVKHIKQDD